MHGRSFKATASHEALFRFAEAAVKSLSQRSPGTIVDGLVRVDIMETDKGNWVVNEFESLEAIYEPPSRDACIVASVNSFLINYWCQVLKREFENGSMNTVCV